jgi:hypothetical protein
MSEPVETVFNWYDEPGTISRAAWNAVCRTTLPPTGARLAFLPPSAKPHNPNRATQAAQRKARKARRKHNG